MGDPELILIDEPSEGLAPVIVQKLGRFIKAIKKDLTILLVEQNVNFGMRISSRGYIIEKSRVRYEGSAEDIRCNEEIRTKYLAV
jgi:branched-chain amino acid transport system ATP-binding protein